jgi:zinc protease
VHVVHACSLALALLTAAPGAPPAVKGAFPYPIHARALPNGLDVLFVPQAAPGIAAYFTFFRVGSRNEVESARSGFAHFFEHLTFRGTKAHSGEDWERITKSLGLDTNAFTDDDVTAYWAVGPSSALPKLIELEADRFMALAYDEDDFKVESRAVLGEFLKDSASPDFKLDEAARELAFTRHTYRHTTMGFEADIRRFPEGYKYSLELYKRFYQPDNAVVLVVGDFDEDATFAAIQRFYGPWKGRGEAAQVQAEPPQEKAKETRLTWPTPILPRHWSGWHTPGAADVGATAAQIVLWPYLFGPASALHRELVIERQLAEEIAGEFSPHRDPFLFGYELILKSSSAEAPARAAVDKALAAVAAGQIDAALLADVKANALSNLVMQTDTPYRTGVWILYYTALTGDPAYLDAVMAAIAKVSAGDLAAFARQWLTPQNRTTVAVATAEKPKAARRSGHAKDLRAAGKKAGAVRGGAR